MYRSQGLSFTVCLETACILTSILFIHQMLSTQLSSSDLLIPLILLYNKLKFAIFFILVAILILIYIFLSQSQKKSFYFLANASFHHHTADYLLLKSPQANFQAFLGGLDVIYQFVLQAEGKHRLHDFGLRVLWPHNEGCLLLGFWGSVLAQNALAFHIKQLQKNSTLACIQLLEKFMTGVQQNKQLTFQAHKAILLLQQKPQSQFD